jgi:hypothetical protein
MKKLILILVLMPVVHVYGQESYRLPANELPVTYLKNLSIDNPTRQLSDTERRELVRLFVEAYVTSVRKYKQDYLLERNTPVYELLKTNFPLLAEREGEGGIFLGSIMRFFNKMPAYRPIIEQTLREDLEKRKRCRS